MCVNVCTHVCLCVHVDRFCDLVLSFCCGFEALNSGCEACMETLLLGECLLGLVINLMGVKIPMKTEGDSTQ